MGFSLPEKNLEDAIKHVVLEARNCLERGEDFGGVFMSHRHGDLTAKIERSDDPFEQDVWYLTVNDGKGVTIAAQEYMVDEYFENGSETKEIILSSVVPVDKDGNEYPDIYFEEEDKITDLKPEWLWLNKLLNATKLLIAKLDDINLT